MWLRANTHLLHDYFLPPSPMARVSFPVPRAATAGGSLSLSCGQRKGTGGTGRTCNIAEVWLRKASNATATA